MLLVTTLVNEKGERIEVKRLCSFFDFMQKKEK
jgi:hypothetical protein